jgi:hypothetical protein
LHKKLKLGVVLYKVHIHHLNDLFVLILMQLSIGQLDKKLTKI